MEEGRSTRTEYFSAEEARKRAERRTRRPSPQEVLTWRFCKTIFAPISEPNDANKRRGEGIGGRRAGERPRD